MKKCLTLVLLCGIASKSWALIVAPPRTEVALTPGTSTQIVLTTTNEDSMDVQVDVSKKNWFLPEANKAWTVDRWMTVEGPAHYSLKPGESRKVTVTVTCPEMTGEVVAMTSFQYRGKEPSMVTPMISVSVYLIAAGTEKMAGEVEDLLVRNWKDQVAVSAKVKSTGNIHIRPSGRLVILDAKDAEVAQMPVPEGQPTYPGTDSVYFGSVPAATVLKPGTYTAKAELNYHDLTLQKSKKFKVAKDGQIQMIEAK